jgi:hypothetical protein
MQINQTELRALLETKIGQNHDLNSHHSNLDEISNHSVSIIQKADPSNDFNCVMYALDFRLEDPTSPFGRYYANTKFLNFLIENSYLIELQPHDNKLNNYAIYYQDNAVQHIGLAVSEEIIESKWGAGHLFSHPIDEVPSSYGNIVRFFHAIDSDLAFNYFMEFYKTP